MRKHQRSLLCERCLIAFLETPAVRYAPENCRD